MITWQHVCGDVSAADALAEFEATRHSESEPLAAWLSRQFREKYAGTEDEALADEVDWEDVARQLTEDYSTGL